MKYIITYSDYFFFEPSAQRCFTPCSGAMRPTYSDVVQFGSTCSHYWLRHLLDADLPLVLAPCAPTYLDVVKPGIICADYWLSHLPNAALLLVLVP